MTHHTPQLTPLVSSCYSGRAQVSHRPCQPAQLADSCLKHLKQHQMLMCWQLNLILENKMFLPKFGPLKVSALLFHQCCFLLLNFLIFVSAVLTSPCPHTGSLFASPPAPIIPGLQIQLFPHSVQQDRHSNSSC